VDKAIATVVFTNPDEMKITYTITVENTGGTVLDNLQVTDDLNATFGSGTFSVNSVSSAAFTENAGYNGDTDVNLLAGTDTLAVGGKGTITVVVTARIARAGLIPIPRTAPVFRRATRRSRMMARSPALSSLTPCSPRLRTSARQPLATR
jgi:uncharacterized repeat protein (TIGR01451 family)